MNKEERGYSVEELLKDEFFIRWVKEPDSESNHYWANVLNSNPQLRENIGKAREILNVVTYKDNYKLSGTEYSEMLDVLVKANHLSKYDKPKRGFILFLSIAASIVLIFSSGLLYYFISSPSEATVTSFISKEHKHTTKGEKLTFKLPDGTSVKLNANSSLSFDPRFSGGVRDVELKGEAYFKVAKDPAHPFVIHTGELSTTVLGTEFNVRSYEEEENIEVAVVEGKVKVASNEADYVYLEPNEVINYHKQEKELNRVNKDVSKLVAWNDNILLFENASSKEVWKKLEDWYGVNIIIKNKKNIEGKYSGEYVNEPLETVLKGISFASGFDFEIGKDKTVIVK